MRFTADHALVIAHVTIATFFTSAVWIIFADAGILPGVGFDFASFWSASALILRNEAVAAYDTAVHFGIQQQLFGNGLTAWSAFFYPPVFLLFCAPLALLPFGWSLLAWTLAGIVACLAALRRIAGGSWILVPGLAFPAFWLNAGFGQNGAFTTALFGWAAVWLDRRPILAGISVGCLCFKPQIGLVMPVALIAARRWQAVAAAALTVVGLSLLSLAAFGTAAWQGFLTQAPLATAGLEHGVVGFDKIISPFSTIRMAGGGIVAAYAVQAVIAVAASVAVALLVRRRPGGAAEIAAAVAATLFCSPFLHVYDLAIMAVPLTWLLTQCRAFGPLPREITGLWVLALTPLPGWTVARLLGLQIAPLISLLLFAMVARRIATHQR